MKPLTKKSELAIEIFCILILLFLNLLVYYNGKNLDCDNCVIEFRASQRRGDFASNQQIQFFSVKVSELYEGLLENYCLVEFNKMQGYILKNATRIK